MAGVLVKMKALYKDFSRAERQIADFIGQNVEKVPYQSVQTLSRAAGVSVASVIRFSQKVGYANFQDFKVNLGQDAASNMTKIYEAITAKDSDLEMVEKVFLGNIRSLEDTLKILTFPDMVRAARLIAKARRVVFFGVGSSGNIAKDSALRFSLLDIQAEAYTDFTMPLQALRMNSEDVAIGISHSGRTIMTAESLKQAKESGAVTVGISNYLRSRLHKVSDLFFCTAFPESKVRVASLSSLIAQSCLVDALYLLTARYKKDLWDVEKMDAITDRLTRWPEK